MNSGDLIFMLSYPFPIVVHLAVLCKWPSGFIISRTGRLIEDLFKLTDYRCQELVSLTACHCINMLKAVCTAAS